METPIVCAGGPGPISGWMQTNIHALYIFTRNQLASYLLSYIIAMSLPIFPGRDFVAGLLAEGLLKLPAGWRAWQRRRAARLPASTKPPALPPPPISSE